MNVKGEKTYELRYWSYYADSIEADELDLVTWEFTATGNTVELHLLNSEGFVYFKATPNRLTIETHGKQLTGQVSGDSGNFQPSRADTWYFVFLNVGATNATAVIEYEIEKIARFYVIVPLVIIVMIGVVLLSAWFFYSESMKKKRKDSLISPTTIQASQPLAHDQSSSEYEFCPECGTKKQGTIPYCANCGFDFRDLKN